MFANLLVNQAAIAAMVGVLVAVAISDVRNLTIPNRYCAAIVLLYPVHVATAPYGVDWIDGIIVGAIAISIGFLLFSMRFAGGGDVKFFAAVSLWAGTHHVAEFTLVTALMGGILAVVMLVRRRRTAVQTTATAGFVGRVIAFVNACLGTLLTPLARHFGIAVSTTYPGSSGAEPAHPESQSNPSGSQPVGTLPYGVAISVGGIVVAAMLLMRG
jgi:prepilin peptidase CpaA